MGIVVSQDVRILEMRLMLINKHHGIHEYEGIFVTVGSNPLLLQSDIEKLFRIRNNAAGNKNFK
jgi:hypothetical protein